MQTNHNRNKKRILIVSTKFPPMEGGVSMAAQELANAFSNLGLAVSVLTSRVPENADERFQFFDLRLATEGTWDNPTPETMALVADAWRQREPQLVVINGVWKEMGNFVIKLAFQYGAPVIYRSHGVSTAFKFSWTKPPFFGTFNWLKSFIIVHQRMQKSASFAQIVFLSRKKGILSNFDRLLADQMHLNNVSDIPNTFNSLLCNQSDSDFRSKYNVHGLLFVCIASFSQLKSQQNVIRAIRNSDVEDTTFLFIGPQRNSYAEKAEALVAGDRRFAFLYNIPRKDVIGAHNSCDCEFLYSTHEQQPLVLLEAMSCKKPWICTDVGSVNEMRGGIILRRRSPKCLVSAIKAMQDTGTRKQCGEEGYQQWQEKFSPDAVYARWDKMLSDIIAHKPVRGGY